MITIRILTPYQRKLAKIGKRGFFPFTVWVVCFVVYFLTMPTTLSWGLNDYGIDSPEFLTSAMVNSNPHPPGYPLYSLILRGFIEIVPAGDVAFKGNLLSVVFGCFTASLLYILIRNLITICSRASSECWWGISSALFGVAFYIFCPLVWGTSLVTEVYSLNSFFCVLLFLLFIGMLKTDSESNTPNTICRSGFFLTSGLAIANHLTVIAIILPMSVCLLVFYRKQLKSFFTACMFLIPGLLCYAYLPIRSIDAHATNWGDPRNLEGFLWMLRGGPYGGYLAPASTDALFERAVWGLNTLYTFLNPLILMFAASGFLHIWEQNKRLFSVLLISAVLFLVYAISYRTIDAEVNIIPTILIFSMMAGVGLFYIISAIRSWELFDRFRRNFGFGPLILQVIAAVIFFLSLTVILTQFIDQYPKMVRANNDNALIRGNELVSTSSPGGIIFLTNEHDVFPAWYVYYVNPHSNQTIPIAIPLMQYSWYWENAIQNGAGIDLPFEPDLFTAIGKIYEYHLGTKDIYMVDKSLTDRFQTEQVGKIYKITGSPQ